MSAVAVEFVSLIVNESSDGDEVVLKTFDLMSRECDYWSTLGVKCLVSIAIGSFA